MPGEVSTAVEEGDSIVAWMSDVSDTGVGTRGRRFWAGRGSCVRVLTLGLLLTIGLALGGCAFKWGDTDEDPGNSSDTTARDRNRLYQQEQQRIYQQRQLDRGGPSDR